MASCSTDHKNLSVVVMHGIAGDACLACNVTTPEFAIISGHFSMSEFAAPAHVLPNEWSRRIY